MHKKRNISQKKKEINGGENKMNEISFCETKNRLQNDVNLHFELYVCSYKDVQQQIFA